MNPVILGNINRILPIISLPWYSTTKEKISQQTFQLWRENLQTLVMQIIVFIQVR